MRVEWEDKDKYGRTLGQIYLGERWINRELVAEGAAWHFKEYSSDRKLAEAEISARNARVGLWAEAAPIPPWDYRHGVRPQTSAQPPPVALQSPPQVSEITVYITKTGEKYHEDGCRYLSKSKIPISLEDAKRRFGACSVCKPPE